MTFDIGQLVEYLEPKQQGTSEFVFGLLARLVHKKQDLNYYRFSEFLQQLFIHVNQAAESSSKISKEGGDGHLRAMLLVDLWPDFFCKEKFSRKHFLYLKMYFHAKQAEVTAHILKQTRENEVDAPCMQQLAMIKALLEVMTDPFQASNYTREQLKKDIQALELKIKKNTKGRRKPTQQLVELRQRLATKKQKLSELRVANGTACKNYKCRQDVDELVEQLITDIQAGTGDKSKVLSYLFSHLPNASLLIETHFGHLKSEGGKYNSYLFSDMEEFLLNAAVLNGLDFDALNAPSGTIDSKQLGFFKTLLLNASPNKYVKQVMVALPLTAYVGYCIYTRPADHLAQLSSGGEGFSNNATIEGAYDSASIVF